MPCLVGEGCGTLPGRPRVEPAHVRTWGSTRRDHGNIVPLCPLHHEEQEGRTRAFGARYGLDLAAIAAELGTLWVGA